MQHQTSEEGREAARAQGLFREVNERISDVTASNALGELTEVLCECADTGCAQPLALTTAEYEAIRREPTHFAVVPGHVIPDVERTISVNDRFAVVEKFGAAGAVAVQLDPRHRSTLASTDGDRG